MQVVAFTITARTVIGGVNVLTLQLMITTTLYGLNTEKSRLDVYNSVSTGKGIGNPSNSN